MNQTKPDDLRQSNPKEQTFLPEREGPDVRRLHPPPRAAWPIGRSFARVAIVMQKIKEKSEVMFGFSPLFKQILGGEHLDRFFHIRGLKIRIVGPNRSLFEQRQSQEIYVVTVFSPNSSRGLAQEGMIVRPIHHFHWQRMQNSFRFQNRPMALVANGGHHHHRFRKCHGARDKPVNRTLQENMERPPLDGRRDQRRGVNGELFGQQGTPFEPPLPLSVWPLSILKWRPIA